MRIIMFLVLQLSLFGADVIGKIIAIDGVVNAIAENVQRVLEKNSDIFALETIVVGSNSRAQIQFTDGGLTNLLPDTEFRVNAYKYKKLLQRDESSSELLKGGLRTLSGSIGKKNPNAYEIKTPSGTIGLRGTVIEAILVGSDLFVGVESGRALVSNEAGSVMIGTGETHQFVNIPGNNVPPVLILKRPQELETSFFAAPQGGLSIDQVKTTQEAKTLPAQPIRGGEASQPTGNGAESGPTIGESPDEGGGSQYTPTGGGASIQGGC